LFAQVPELLESQESQLLLAIGKVLILAAPALQNYRDLMGV